MTHLVPIQLVIQEFRFPQAVSNYSKMFLWAINHQVDASFAPTGSNKPLLAVGQEPSKKIAPMP